MNLVYLSPVPWDSFAQRPHKFVEWFQSRTGGQVLWLDPYPTRLPKLVDFRHRPTPLATKSKDSCEWISVARPTALPIEPLPGLSSINRFLWSAIFSQVRDFLKGNDSLIVAGKPSILASILLSEHSTTPSLYDAMDDFPAFYTGASRAMMKRREIQLIRKCGHIWVSSTRLHQRLSEIRPDLELVRNGLEPTLFVEAAKTKTEEGKKVFGYVGTIATWFDWAWVIKLANARPKDVVRLIGPISTPLPAQLPVNVELLPPCSHEDAIRAMNDFDVGIIPFKNNLLTASVDPIKYYEYRATGLPVISTDFGEMTLRHDSQGTFISSSVQDIEELAGRALLHRDRVEFVSSFVTANSWNERFDRTELINIINKPDRLRPAQ